MERETSDVTIQEEFILAKILTPLLELEASELLLELDRLQERKPRIPDIALYILIQVRVGMRQLLEKLPPERHTQNNQLILLKASFKNLMRKKVSGVLKELSESQTRV
jgi:hypothetical protein